LLEYLEWSVFNLSPAYFQETTMGLKKTQEGDDPEADVVRHLEHVETVYSAGWVLINDQLKTTLDFQ
jgi:hypothetical protein